MKIKLMMLPVKDLVQGYEEDDSTSRVRAWGGKLDVRPEYQREYVYGEGKRDAVINTVLQGFPLNIMYFVDRKDGTYEVLDGQQRIISICRYYTNKYSVKVPSPLGGFDTVNFPNLFESDETDPEPFTKQKFLEYELQVYICEGTEAEKIAWFQTINLAGEELEDQEILNAVLHSAWLTDAKSAFSRRNCAAYKNYGKYMNGDYIRQKYLETAFKWAADAEGIAGKDAIAQYMRAHRNDKNADALWKYFEDVFSWVKDIFGKTIDPSMKGVQWGLLYNQHRYDNLDPAYIQKRMKELYADKEVGKRSGIYQYLLEGETTAAEKYLSLRQFDKDDMAAKYHEQNGLCAICGKPFDLKDMNGDHIVPWSKGGKTVYDNLQMLCVPCNLAKSNH